jgi:hypothetical protein
MSNDIFWKKWLFLSSSVPEMGKNQQQLET